VFSATPALELGTQMTLKGGTLLRPSTRSVRAAASRKLASFAQLRQEARGLPFGYPSASWFKVQDTSRNTKLFRD
jgi:hypothetical protein